MCMSHGLRPNILGMHGGKISFGSERPSTRRYQSGSSIVTDQKTESPNGTDDDQTERARELSPQDKPLISQEGSDDIPEELLADLPEEIRVAFVEIMRSQSFRGPLPPPEMLDEYEKVLPGAAERIFKMAETEQGHRVSWERKALKAVTRGQWFGFTIAIVAILISAGLAVEGYTTMAIVLAGGGLLGPVWSILRSIVGRDGNDS